MLIIEVTNAREVVRRESFDDLVAREATGAGAEEFES